MLFAVAEGDIVHLLSADLAAGTVSELAQGSRVGGEASVIADAEQDLIFLSAGDGARILRAEKVVQESGPLDYFFVSAEFIAGPHGTTIVAVASPKTHPPKLDQLVTFTDLEEPRELADLGRDAPRRTLGVLTDGSVLVLTAKGAQSADWSLSAVRLDGSVRALGSPRANYGFDAVLMHSPAQRLVALRWDLQGPAFLESLDPSSGNWEQLDRFGEWHRFAPQHNKSYDGLHGPVIGLDAATYSSPLATRMGFDARIAWSPDDAFLAGQFGGLGTPHTLAVIAADGTQVLRVDVPERTALTIVGWSGARSGARP